MDVPAGRGLHDWMTDFVRKIGLPTRLSELGVQPDVLPEIAEKASRDHLSVTNPRPAGAKDYLDLMGCAM